MSNRSWKGQHAFFLIWTHNLAHSWQRRPPILNKLCCRFQSVDDHHLVATIRHATSSHRTTHPSVAIIWVCPNMNKVREKPAVNWEYLDTYSSPLSIGGGLWTLWFQGTIKGNWWDVPIQCEVPARIRHSHYSCYCSQGHIWMRRQKVRIFTCHITYGLMCV